MSGGELSSPEMLISGGLLVANGTIISAGGSTGVCCTGGTVMPVGTLAIEGDYTQTGGALAYELLPMGASGRLAVQGTATLGGTLGMSVAPGLYGLSTRYARVLRAGAVNGQLAQVSWLPPAIFLRLERPIYDPASVDLTLDRTPFGPVPAPPSLGRACAVGNAQRA